MMKTKHIGWLAGLLLFSFSLSYAQLDGNDIAPDFSLGDLDGNIHHLYDYLDDNKVVVLDFFAVWCSICQADASYLQDIHSAYGPDGSDQIVMLSLEADDATSDIQTHNYAQNFGSTNPHINATKSVPDLFNVNFYPTYYVIAPDRSYTLITGRQVTLKEQMIAAIESAPLLREVDNDIRLHAYSGPVGSICSTAVYPEIRIQNYGRNAITSMQVVTEVDGEIASVYPFIDTLQPYHYTNLRLPWLVNLEPGWHQVNFTFPQVNGLPDGDPENGIQGGYFLILPDGEQLSIQFTSDAYPKESSWKIVEGDKLVAEKGGYEKGLTTDTTLVCVEKDACYRLVLYDSFGDGMSSGGLAIHYLDEKIAELSGFEFSGDSVWVDFCVRPGTSGVNDLYSDSDAISVYPNPSNGIISLSWPDEPVGETQITVLNALGSVVLSKYLPQQSNYYQFDLSDCSGGIYFVRFESKTRKLTKRIVIN